MSKKSTSIIRRIIVALSGSTFIFMTITSASVSISSFIICGLLILLLIMGIIKCPDNPYHKPYLNSIILAVALSLLIGIGFYEVWSPSSQLMLLSTALGLSTKTVLLVLSVSGVFLSAIFLEMFLSYPLLGRRHHKQFSSDECKDKKSGLWSLCLAEWILCLFLALYTSLNFDTCPFSNSVPKTDSAVFLYIGNRMHEGFVPYLDLFDHKGLLLYFYQYIGLLISGDTYIGIWIIEFVNIFVSYVLIVMVAKIFTRKKSVACVCALLIALIFHSKIFEGGNFTEEYALPWLLLSLYIFMKYYKTERFRIWEIALIGASFVAVLMLRVNMISTWIAFMPLIFVKMIFKKEWKNLGRASFGFLSGVVLALLPFAIYLFTHGGIKAMWDYYIDFNLSYSGQISSIGLRISNASALLRALGPLSLFAYLISLSGKDKFCVLNAWFSLVTFLLVNLSGQSYKHYDIVMMPTLVISLIYSLEVGFDAVKLYRKPLDTQRCLIMEKRITISCFVAAAILSGMTVLSTERNVPHDLPIADIWRIIQKRTKTSSLSEMIVKITWRAIARQIISFFIKCHH